jgi:hypothetical protein
MVFASVPNRSISKTSTSGSKFEEASIFSERIICQLLPTAGCHTLPEDPVPLAALGMGVALVAVDGLSEITSAEDGLGTDEVIFGGAVAEEEAAFEELMTTELASDGITADEDALGEVPVAGGLIPVGAAAPEVPGL